MIDTEIRILRELERDLELAAATEVRIAELGDRRSWKARIGAGAAVLLVAWGIGWVATHDLGLSTSSESRAESFSTVGSAVNGAGGKPANQPPSASRPPSSAPGQDLAKIVRDGSLTLVIPNGTFDERFADVVRITDRNGGFVLSQSTEGSDSGSFVLRIPAKRFDAAMGAIRVLGRTESSQVTGKDVTDQYIDQQARLAILKARRASLLRLLDQATTLSASLTLSDRIDEVQLDIEQAQGELRFLDAQVAESTLHVDMHEADSTAAVSSEGGTGIRNPSLGRAVDRAVQGFLGVIATVLVGLGYLLPLTIIFGLGFAAWRVARRRREPVV
jgi:Domain of unknown function (DUF4349)